MESVDNDENMESVENDESIESIENDESYWEEVAMNMAMEETVMEEVAVDHIKREPEEELRYFWYNYCNKDGLTAILQ